MSDGYIVPSAAQAGFAGDENESPLAVGKEKLYTVREIVPAGYATTYETDGTHTIVTNMREVNGPSPKTGERG